MVIGMLTRSISVLRPNIRHAEMPYFNRECTTGHAGFKFGRYQETIKKLRTSDLDGLFYDSFIQIMASR